MTDITNIVTDLKSGMPTSVVAKKYGLNYHFVLGVGKCSGIEMQRGRGGRHGRPEKIKQAVRAVTAYALENKINPAALGAALVYDARKEAKKSLSKVDQS